MTDRIRTLTVILDHDYRDDDVEAIAGAIRMICGVSQVHNGEPVSFAEEVARDEFRRMIGNQIIELINKR